MGDDQTMRGITVKLITVDGGPSLGDSTDPVWVTNQAILDAVDGATTAFRTVTYAHHEIHSGSSFAVGHNGTINADATIEITFKTPDTTKWAHMVVSSRSSGEANICIYEEATVTAGSGTEKTIYNRNRNSATTSTLINNADPAVAGLITVDPTVTDDGTCIYEEHFGSGQTRGGAVRGTDEFVLKQNAQYVIRVTSEAAANDCDICLNWYEHTDVA
jgi:hypothetical protein